MQSRSGHLTSVCWHAESLQAYDTYLLACTVVAGFQHVLAGMQDYCRQLVHEAAVNLVSTRSSRSGQEGTGDSLLMPCMHTCPEASVVLDQYQAQLARLCCAC